MGDELTTAKGHLKLAEIALVEGDLQTMSAFVREKSYQQYDIPGIASTLEACKCYIAERKEK